MAREINLVPDIKGEMIKALKLRNFIFFVCIVVATASVVVTALFASIAIAQKNVVDGKKNTIELLSSKINSYEDLADFLTIKDQLGNLSSISNNKTLLSRSFGILATLLPSGADTITISELSIDLSDGAPTFSFDAQANAGSDPYIDYNVLDSFKKSMQYMRYDYGNYVDREGNTIPAYCMIETGADGATFYDEAKQSYYAYWDITASGCNVTHKEETAVEDEEENSSDNKAVDNTPTDASMFEDVSPVIDGYVTTEYAGKSVVRVWRTPQFNEWYREEETEDVPYMSLSGQISNVPHFESQCTTYSGTVNEAAGRVDWHTTNETCMLVPEGIDGIRITDSSNGRGSSGDLVLRFSAVITFDPGAFSFSNKHMLAIAPSGRHNVTDSYVQIQSMFAEAASECAAGDTACKGGN